MSTQRMRGVVVGLVTDVQDPDGLGRVRLTFPWLSDDNVSRWARVAALHAGPSRGQLFPPEVGDEALVAFEMDDVNRPYVLGYLYNGSSKPPGDSATVRVLHTVSGHKLTFDDTGGSEAVTVEDAGGNTIRLDADGVRVESAGDVVIKGRNVTIEASAQLTAKGNPIHLNP